MPLKVLRQVASSQRTRQFGKPSLVCDFQELYRYFVDDFVIQYSLKLKPKDFVLKDEYYSINKKGKRQCLKEAKNRDFIKRLNLYFQSKVEIPGIRVGKKQEIETLINEEALLFAKYLGNERKTWKPRIVARACYLHDNLSALELARRSQYTNSEIKKGEVKLRYGSVY